MDTKTAEWELALSDSLSMLDLLKLGATILFEDREVGLRGYPETHYIDILINDGMNWVSDGLCTLTEEGLDYAIGDITKTVIEREKNNGQVQIN